MNTIKYSLPTVSDFFSVHGFEMFLLPKFHENPPITFWLMFTNKQIEAKYVLLDTNRTQAAERAETAVFVPGDLDLWPLTLTFKLTRTRKQTRLPCEFGVNPFSGSRDISYTNKKTQTDDAKNRTFRSSVRAVKMAMKTVTLPKVADVINSCIRWSQ